MSQTSWRSESDAVLHSPTKRELQARERALRKDYTAQTSKFCSTCKAWLIAGVLLVICTVVLIPVIVTQMAVHGPRLRRPLNVAYCHRLPEGPQQLCDHYHEARGSAKFAAATAWRQASLASYLCAGIEAECLNVDLQSNSTGTACQALADGAHCGDQQRKCSAGFCGGLEAAAMSAADTARFDAPDAPLPAAAAAAAADTSKPVSAAAEGADEADDTITPAEIMLHRIPAIPAAPNASWPTAVASIWPSNIGKRVPETFLATSHEWRRIKDYGGANVQAWANVFGMLSNSPVIRIGGASQDAMAEVPGPDVWGALIRLQRATNCRYIIGLPLWQKNAIDMSQQIMKDAQKNLGDALMGFELGNEPEFWPTGLGGYDEHGKWVSGFEAFAAYFNRVARALNPCTPGKANTPLLSGPGWGNVNTQDPSWFAKIVSQGAGCYFWESNTHYYPYVNNETVTNQELLSQWLQDFALDKFKAYAKVSQKAGLNIRISETNSMYGGGRKDLSETMAGTLWTADALFAFANAGARAFHLHWGKGGDTNGDAPPSVGVQTNFDFKVPEGQPPLPWPSVHAPWYGYLMWTIAAAGGYGKAVDTNFVVANVDRWDECTANIKVWALRSDDDQIRIALLNKDLDKSCNLDIRLEPKFCSTKATFARLLPGKKGMESKAGVTWQGQHYVGAATTGVIQGRTEIEAVRPRTIPGKACSFAVSLPKTSAALLVVTTEKPAV